MLRVRRGFFRPDVVVRNPGRRLMQRKRFGRVNARHPNAHIERNCSTTHLRLCSLPHLSQYSKNSSLCEHLRFSLAHPVRRICIFAIEWDIPECRITIAYRAAQEHAHWFCGFQNHICGTDRIRLLERNDWDNSNPCFRGAMQGSVSIADGLTALM